jgi:Golgi SNAP receptor complex protein 1
MHQGNVQAAVDHANLLSGVRNDIESVLLCQSLPPGLVYLTPKFTSSAYKSSAAEALLVERGRIDSSHQMMDDTLEYALNRFLVAPTNR